MDAAELARQSAAKYHAEAVARGLDPWHPFSFAIEEAKRRDIDAEPTASGSTILRGSRATFIPTDQLIVYEDSGTPFDKAFLIAHEIGHSELGDDVEGDPAVQIDPGRPAEASPVGIDRVVDYGRRQRREVQMDLFAREFLLPRSVVKKLHLVDKLSATDMATKLGAPFEVVAQQLLDALLLPAIVVDSKPKEPPPPNELQIDAAKHRGPPFLLEAGPGTGKTQTLSLRVDGLLTEGVDPRRILLLTFSNKAAGEMAERIARKNKDAAAAMWIGTFHAFGLDIIRRFHSELGLPDDPRMLDRTEAAEILENEFPRIGLVHYRDLYDPTQIIADILTAISRAKDEVTDAATYAALAQEMLRKAGTDEERILAGKAMEVAKVYAAYEDLKRQQNCIDFGDLVSMPVRLIETNAAVRAELQGKYDHILVDEYQDVNRSSVRLLTALKPTGENLWVVGDAKQSIYRFRGASSFNMSRFGKEDFPGGVRGRLKLNYRSVGEIVDTFSAFAVEMQVGDADSGLESRRGASGNKPELLTTGTADDQTVVVADTIEAMRLAGHSYRDQAVLCTGNDKLSRFGQDLERLGIPVLFLGSLFERPEIKDLFALLSLLVDKRATGLLRIGCWAEFEMSFDDITKVVDYFRTNEVGPGEWLGQTDKVQGLSEKSRVGLQKLAETLKGFKVAAAPWDVLARVLLDRTQIAARIGASETIKDRARGIAIWQLMNFLRAQPKAKGLPITRAMDRVRRLLRLGDDRDLRQLPAAAQGIDAVRLMTIHGAKGLEFPVVHVPGLNSGTMPRTAPRPACLPPDGMVEGAKGGPLESFHAGQAEEQECLFYVALSRARDRLYLYAPTKMTNGRNRNLSPFIDQLGTTLGRRAGTPSRELPGAPEDIPVQISFEGGLSVKVEQLSLYGRCQRRFLYTHILQIGGRRRVTAFMQMHEAVRTVLKGEIDGTAPISNAEELERRISEAFEAHDLAEHGYAKEYKAFAVPMLRFLRSIRENHAPQPITALRLAFEDEEVLVMPDDVLLKPNGRRSFRRIKTGHHREDDAESVDAAALILAAKQAFPAAVVELICLSDERQEPLSMTDRKLENRRQTISDQLKAIRSGQFPANPSQRSCPNCPAFFVCGELPQGSLRKKL